MHPTWDAPKKLLSKMFSGFSKKYSSVVSFHDSHKDNLLLAIISKICVIVLFDCSLIFIFCWCFSHVTCKVLNLITSDFLLIFCTLWLCSFIDLKKFWPLGWSVSVFSTFWVTNLTPSFYFSLNGKARELPPRNLFK